MAPVMLALYAMIFLRLLKVVNTRGTVPAPEKTQRRVQSLDIPIAVLALLATTSFAFSIYKHDSFYALLRLFAYIGLYYVIMNEFDHRMRKRVIWVAISVGSGLSLYGLLQYFGVFDKSWWYPPQFLAATYVNHNHFAGYLELVIPVALSIAVRRKSEDIVYGLCLAAAIVVMSAALLLTQSRGAWISLGASIAIMLMAMLRSEMSLAKKSLVVACLLLAVLALLYFSQDVVTTRLETLSGVSSGEDVSGGRLKIWQGAMGMIKARPLLGVGISNFDSGFYRYRPTGLNVRVVYAHNDYLQAATEMGLVAPVFMVWIFALTVSAGLKKDAGPYAFGCATGVLSLAIHGLVDFNFHITANMIVFVIWIAITMGESCDQRA
ncbi:MAG: O-antigen ligase family protein [Candidatus Omnitrophica bacterium]|nr:O-antigen ligase family protein [Candidatus Omnitrophota bacterium]